MKNEKPDEQIRIVKKGKESLTVSRLAFVTHYKKAGYKEFDGFPEMTQEVPDENTIEVKFADDYPGATVLNKIKETREEIDALDRDGLIAIKGIAGKTADAIIAEREKTVDAG